MKPKPGGPREPLAIYVRTVDPKSKWLRRNEVRLKKVMRRAFEDADFTDRSFNTERVLKSCFGRDDLTNTTHIVATGPGGKVYGAFFHVPKTREPGEKYADMGWFFTAKGLTPDERLRTAKSLMNRAHSIIANAGYRGVATTMGTMKGALFLEKRAGYKLLPPNEFRGMVWLKEFKEPGYDEAKEAIKQAARGVYKWRMGMVDGRRKLVLDVENATITAGGRFVKSGRGTNRLLSPKAMDELQTNINSGLRKAGFDPTPS